MFEAATKGRNELAEVMGLQKRLSELTAEIPQSNAGLRSNIVAAQGEVEKILDGNKEIPGSSEGLEQAVQGLAGALKVVESSDREVPSQALDLFKQSSGAAKERLEEWERLKSTRLTQLNLQLKQVNMSPLILSEIEADDVDEIFATE